MSRVRQDFRQTAPLEPEPKSLEIAQKPRRAIAPHPGRGKQNPGCESVHAVRGAIPTCATRGHYQSLPAGGGEICSTGKPGQTAPHDQDGRSSLGHHLRSLP